MGIIEKAREDFLQITSNSDTGPGVEMTFYAPTNETATVKGLHSKHHLGVDPDTGKFVNTKNAHASVSEKLLTDAGYPVRDANGEVNMRKHRVDVKDSTGNVKSYIISENFPDETLGFLVFSLKVRNG